jgi:nitroimidazol reductase NimA-like FMN-containing flavoprotein (pyridoxamine 5'-phosphate oxidase superfamily)
MDALWNTVDELTPHACLSLLARHSFGRVGLSVDALPVVLPVNYVLDGERIVVRTGQGSKLAAALRNAVVCFEIDSIDPVGGIGWSVLVTGVAEELHGADAVRAATLPLRSWSPSATDHVVGISVDVVTGRRVGPALAARPSAISR